MRVRLKQHMRFRLMSSPFGTLLPSVTTSHMLAMKLLNGEIKEGDEVTVDVTGPEGRILDFKVKK